MKTAAGLISLIFLCSFTVVAHSQTVSEERSKFGDVSGATFQIPDDLVISSTFIFETVAAWNETSQYNTSYIARPALFIKSLDLLVSLQLALNVPHSVDLESESVPENFLENPSILIAKSVNELSFGLIGTLPANRVANELGFNGSAGPFVKFDYSIDRVKVSPSLVYQRRSYSKEKQDDESRNDPNVFRLIIDASYEFVPALAATAGMQLTRTVDGSWAEESGGRYQISVDYRVLEKIAVSCGWAVEMGLAATDGVANNSDQQLAFLDFILEL